MGSICPATFQCRKQAIQPMRSAIATSLKKQQALVVTTKFQAFLERAHQRGAMESQNADASSQPAPLPLLHQSDECDKKPESAQAPPPPGPSLSQRVLRGNHVLQGAV